MEVVKRRRLVAFSAMPFGGQSPKRNNNSLVKMGTKHRQKQHLVLAYGICLVTARFLDLVSRILKNI